jgi:hypothetical protein
MNSDTVYQVAKALPKEEQVLLFEKLKKDFMFMKKVRHNNSKVYEREEAIDYLLSHVFNKKKYNKCG